MARMEGPRVVEEDLKDKRGSKRWLGLRRDEA